MLEAKQVKFDLFETIESTANFAAEATNQKDVEFYVRYDVYSPRFVIGNVKRLRQILQNLVSYAVTITEKGNILLKMEKLQEDNNSIQLQFLLKATDPGLNSDEINHIWENSKSVKGNDVGESDLGITKEIVKLLNGNISVSSLEGTGTEFKIILPFLKSDETQLILDLFGEVNGQFLFLAKKEFLINFKSNEYAPAALNFDFCFTWAEFFEMMDNSVRNGKKHDGLIVNEHFIIPEETDLDLIKTNLENYGAKLILIAKPGFRIPEQLEDIPIILLEKPVTPSVLVTLFQRILVEKSQAVNKTNAVSEKTIEG